MKQKTKRVVSFRAAVERVFWRAKKRSLCSLSSLSSLVGKKKQLSIKLSLEEKSIIFSTRASFFVSDSREKKKMFSSAQARSTMIGSSSSVRSTRSSSKVRSTTVRVRAMKGACNLFSSAFFFKKMCVGFWRERARGPRCSERVNMIVDRRDASTIERERDDCDDVSSSVFSISIFTDLYFYL